MADPQPSFDHLAFTEHCRDLDMVEPIEAVHGQSFIIMRVTAAMREKRTEFMHLVWRDIFTRGFHDSRSLKHLESIKAATFYNPEDVLTDDVYWVQFFEKQREIETFRSAIQEGNGKKIIHAYNALLEIGFSDDEVREIEYCLTQPEKPATHTSVPSAGFPLRNLHSAVPIHPTTPAG